MLVAIVRSSAASVRESPRLCFERLHVAHIVGFPGPPMTEAPDFLLETPKPLVRRLIDGRDVTIGKQAGSEIVPKSMKSDLH